MDGNRSDTWSTPQNLPIRNGQFRGELTELIDFFLIFFVQNLNVGGVPRFLTFYGPKSCLKP